MSVFLTNTHTHTSTHTHTHPLQSALRQAGYITAEGVRVRGKEGVWTGLKRTGYIKVEDQDNYQSIISISIIFSEVFISHTENSVIIEAILFSVFSIAKSHNPIIILQYKPSKIFSSI